MSVVYGKESSLACQPIVIAGRFDTSLKRQRREPNLRWRFRLVSIVPAESIALATAAQARHKTGPAFRVVPAGIDQLSRFLEDYPGGVLD
jgi:hypothetical protein